jgi:hypothetical protein
MRCRSYALFRVTSTINLSRGAPAVYACPMLSTALSWCGLCLTRPRCLTRRYRRTGSDARKKGAEHAEMSGGVVPATFRHPAPKGKAPPVASGALCFRHTVQRNKPLQWRAQHPA